MDINSHKKNVTMEIYRVEMDVQIPVQLKMDGYVKDNHQFVLIIIMVV